jgi:hypothetical protein
MSVLVIRAHKRFSVCREIVLHGGRDKVAAGLLIEISLEGCRISGVEPDMFAVEECLKVEIEGWKPFGGQVRWQHDGMIGLRLAQPFHNGELAKLLDFCRGETGLKQARRA